MRFLKRFSTSLTLLAKRQKIDVPNSADALCLKLMPSVYKIKKASFESKLDRMFHFVKQNASIVEAVKGKDAVHHKQPYLIVLGSFEHPLFFNLVVDQTVIPLGPDCRRAFNILFASFWIFRLEYPTYLDKFFLFFEQFVYQVFLGEDCYTISSSNQDFANVLDDIASKNMSGAVGDV
ncbi:uncharacterized protein LOC123475754 isoform X2 [Daphnia magna]|uniref:uncharacterized protein LOC123475754 isoform X2 n=1 Tax=Daphnia magna TaxID=35525 RepID=UPI001E1BAC2B|nr:uncharacterized protein LOC123475754 isoform X2 [Daphnia magna]